MLLPRNSWALALFTASASAFRDTSPFFIISDFPFSSTLSESQVVRAEAVHASLTGILKSCQWSTYLVVSQPSVSAQDFANGPDSTPALLRQRENTTSSAWSRLVVSDVLGDLDEDKLVDELTQQCKATTEAIDAQANYLPRFECEKDTDEKRILKVSFDSPPAKQPQRAEKLLEHESFLNALLSNIKCDSTLIIYTTTPIAPITDAKHSSPHHELHLYDSEDPFQQALHVDLKRDFEATKASNASLPLFETYQYFTPAIFMGGLVSILLFLILYVGVSAVAGLEVSYFAFSKEMGPAAQKKQQ